MTENGWWQTMHNDRLWMIIDNGWLQIMDNDRQWIMTDNGWETKGDDRQWTTHNT